MSLLLEAKADHSLRNENGHTALARPSICVLIQSRSRTSC
jgi:hypothetical protein